MARSIKLKNNDYIDSTGIVHNRKLLSQILDQENLIAEVVASGSVKTLSLSNLNLSAGRYKLLIAEYSTGTTSTGHVLTINNKANYITRAIHTNGSVLDSFSRTDGLALTNGWSAGTNLFFTSVDIQYFNKDWIGCESIGGTDSHLVVQHGYLKMAEITKINSIEITAKDSDNIGVGSYMRLYKYK